MKKNTLAIFLLTGVLIAGIFLIYKYNSHMLAWQANKNIDVEGVRLMMPEDGVWELMGEAENHIPGFGGYRLEYLAKGIFLTFLNDSDTDFYRKVQEITMTDSKYEIYGIKVGDEYDKAMESVYNQGFIARKEGFSGLWKKSLYIILEKNNDKIGKITIGIRDGISSRRIY